jgi:cell division protein ZapE
MAHELVACVHSQAASRGFALDASQQLAITELQRLYDDLQQTGSLRHLLRNMLKPQAIRGVYLWGGVGRGKSFIMDAFFACVPLKQKQRLHYHHFMHDIHHRLAAMKGQTEPLTHIAQEISRSIRLLCLDEFHINDIADAMLMRGLLQGLLDHGVAVVVTSNAEPDSLYRNGLQRSQFVPCVDLIKAQMTVLQLDGGTDYRCNALELAGVYHTPLNANAERALVDIFKAQAGGSGRSDVALQVGGRSLDARYQGDGVAGFGFVELCGDGRSKSDYIELAARFHTLLLFGVPQLDEQKQSEARRFLWLIDELYDRRVKLILSAAVPLAQLAPATLFEGEFERALSRLAEMQSHDYLMQLHKAE